MARPLVLLPHCCQGARPGGHCSSTMGAPMGGTPSPVPIGQPVCSSSGELGVLSGPHHGTPTPVPVFFSASWQFTLLAKHIPGVQNSAADAISRGRARTLPLLVPQANPTPSHLPSTLQDLLLAPDACWTSPHWRRGFRSFMLTASPAIPQGPMTRGSDVSSGSVRPPV